MTAVENEDTAARPSALLGRDLGVPSIVFMVVAAAAPLAVAAAAFPLIFSFAGSPGAPLFYVMAGAVLLLFAVGFTTMSRYVRNAGAFYSYIQLGLGRIPGIGAALLALLSYMCLLVGNFLYLGFAIPNTITNYVGDAFFPWWSYSIVVAVATAVIGYRDIELSAKVLGVILVIEVLLVIVTDVAIALRGGAAGLSASPFSPSNLEIGVPALGVMFAFLSFIGFEATAVFRNEAKDPDRTIPRATYIAVICIGLFYAVSSWSAAVGLGPDKAADASTSDLGGVYLNLAGDYVHVVLKDIMLVSLIGSFFAATLAVHNVCTRYLFTLGETHVLPTSLARVHDRHRSPSYASLVVTGISSIALFFGIVSGLDPLTKIYPWTSGAATLGLVALMSLTSLSVILFFRITTHDKRIWRTVVAPAIACIGLTILLFLVIKYFPLLAGSKPAAIATGSVVGAAFVGGMLLALSMRARRREAYMSLIDEG